MNKKAKPPLIYRDVMANFALLALYCLAIWAGIVWAVYAALRAILG